MKSSKSSFKIELDGNLILLKTIGAPSAGMMKAMLDETNQTLKKKHAPQDILVTTGGFGILGPQAFKVAVQALNEIPFRRVAVCGTIPSRIAPAKTIIKSSEKSERVKLFRNENDARAWLEEEAQPIRTKLRHQTNKLRPINKTTLGQFIMGVVIIPPG